MMRQSLRFRLSVQYSAIVFGLSFATVLTLVVTPSMLMVFTRAKPQAGHRSLWSRLLRRGKGKVSSETGPQEPAAAEPDIAYPKAAE